MPTEVEDREVDLADAAKEQSGQETEQEAVDVADILVPKVDPKTWTVGREEDGTLRTFVQRPLGFLAKVQWFSLVGDVLDKAMSGENALSVNALMDAPRGGRGALTLADFRDADTFIQAIGKLISASPDFLERSYCIWLGVPDWERELVIEAMSKSPDEGGLSDDDGIEIIEIFIDQNWAAISRFFQEKLAGLQRRVQEKTRESSSQRSTPSSTTPRTTQRP